MTLEDNMIAAPKQRTTHTRQFMYTERERRLYIDFLLGMWDKLEWRHAGFGALQAYIRQGDDKREVRVHVFHPNLVKKGIIESGACHDHRFLMRSFNLLGSFYHVEYKLYTYAFEADSRPYEMYHVVHAREAMKETGSFHKDPVLMDGKYYRKPRSYIINPGTGYVFDKFIFHETKIRELAVTLIEKWNQEPVCARILAPVDEPIVHAFENSLTRYQFQPILDEAFNELLYSQK